MLSNLRIYKVGSTFKYISIPVINKSLTKNYVNNKYINKLDNNLIRAKTKVKDLILCNDFKFFITITVNPKYDRFDLTRIRKIVNHRIRTIRNMYKGCYDLNLHFLFIPEQHKNGAWHLHGVLSRDFERFIHNNDYLYQTCDIFDTLGFNSISIINDIDRVGSYITKYITKDISNISKGKHTYFCSQGLSRPVLVNSVIYNNEFFNRQFFDFKNDFCYVKYDKKYYNFITNLI